MKIFGKLMDFFLQGLYFNSKIEMIANCTYMAADYKAADKYKIFVIQFFTFCDLDLVYRA